MELQELRIGNLVTWADEDDPNNAILTVVGLNLGDTIFLEWEWEDGEKDNTDCDLDAIKPIPLTEEILLKCGVDEGVRVIIKCKSKKIVFGWSTKIVATGVRNGWYSRKYNHIKHLHQLQNLYMCLCGKELDVKL